MKNTPFRSWMMHGAILTLSVVSLLFLAEWIFRQIRPDLIPSRQLRTIDDPNIGWKFQPGQQLKGWDESGQPRACRVNSIGFPDNSHATNAPPGTLRVAFLGDSFTAALGVDFSASFPRVTESILQAKSPAASVEILNFGMPGFGTANEYLAWKHCVAPFKPSIVLLAFFLGNDVANHLPGYPQEGFIRPQFDRHGIQTNVMGGICRVVPPRNWFRRTFLDSSLLYQQYKLFERDLRHRWKAGRSKKKSAEDHLPFWKRSHAPIDWQTYLPQPGEEFEEAWKVTEALVLKLSREVRESGAEFRVILIPGLEAMDPKGFSAAVARYPELKDVIFDPDWPRKRMTGFLKKQAIPFLDLTPVIQRKISQSSPSGVYFSFDRHFNQKGHRLAGEAIAEWLLPTHR